MEERDDAGSGFQSGETDVSTLANALTRHWLKGELLIAEAMGKRPEEIWPSRYLRVK
nr:helix-turn-helix domain-containing protein [Dickeya zeae]